MKRFAIVFALWVVLFGLGLGGMFSGNSTFMGICFALWTPLIFLLGRFSIGVGYALFGSPPPAVEPRRERSPLQQSPVVRRERKVS